VRRYLAQSTCQLRIRPLLFRSPSYGSLVLQLASTCPIGAHLIGVGAGSVGVVDELERGGRRRCTARGVLWCGSLGRVFVFCKNRRVLS
jgi:hypothetical protein